MEIQRRLTANRRTAVVPACRGDALVQGPLRCAVHDKGLFTVYPLRGRRPDGSSERRAVYCCRPFRDRANGHEHGWMPASQVDPAIEAEVLATLAPPGLDAIHEATRAALREHDMLLRGRQDELRRADHTVSEAERAFDQADSAHGHLRRRLAERFDNALRQRGELLAFHRSHPLVPPLTLDEHESSELRALLSNLPRLWRHPTVTSVQRKTLVRTIIRAIAVTPCPDRWHMTIHWVGGAESGLEVRRPLWLPLAASRSGMSSEERQQWQALQRELLTTAYPLIRARAEVGVKVPAIVRELNEHGVHHPLGPWTRSRVAGAIRQLRLGRVPGLERLPPRCADQELLRAAYPLIRARAEVGVRLAAIVRELNDGGIRHPQGQWTYRRVVNAITRLRLGRVPGLEPLSTPPPLAEQVLALHRQGLSTMQITAALRAAGVRTRHRTLVSANTVHAVLRRLGLKDLRARHNQEVIERLRSWAGALTAEEAAQRLNAEGLQTGYGRPWSAASIRLKLRDLNLHPRYLRRPRAGRSRARGPSAVVLQARLDGI